MSSSPSIGIVVTVCNGEAHLTRQLESLLAQTDPADEVLLLEDASEDSSADIAKSFADRGGQSWRLLRNPSRLGLLGNLQQGLTRATADVILLCDQDDVWMPDKVSAFRRTFETEPRLVAAFSDARVCDAKLQPLGYSLWQVEAFSCRERQLVRAGELVRVLADRNVVQGASLAFRRDLLTRILPFPTGLHFRLWCHDGWIAAISSGLGPVGMIDRPLMDYRIHGGNQIGRFRRRDVLRRWMPRSVRTFLRSLLQARQAGMGTGDIRRADLGHQIRHLEFIRERLAKEPAAAATSALAARLAAARSVRLGLPGSIRSRIRAILSNRTALDYGQEAHPLKHRARDALDY